MDSSSLEDKISTIEQQFNDIDDLISGGTVNTRGVSAAWTDSVDDDIVRLEDNPASKHDSDRNDATMRALTGPHVRAGSATGSKAAVQTVSNPRNGDDVVDTHPSGAFSSVDRERTTPVLGDRREELPLLQVSRPLRTTDRASAGPSPADDGAEATLECEQQPVARQCSAGRTTSGVAAFDDVGSSVLDHGNEATCDQAQELNLDCLSSAHVGDAERLADGAVSPAFAREANKILAVRRNLEKQGLNGALVKTELASDKPVPPEFRDGTIAAMKDVLSKKGLEVKPKGKGVRKSSPRRRSSLKRSASKSSSIDRADAKSPREDSSPAPNIEAHQQRDSPLQNEVEHVTREGGREEGPPANGDQRNELAAAISDEISDAQERGLAADASASIAKVETMDADHKSTTQNIGGEVTGEAATSLRNSAGGKIAAMRDLLHSQGIDGASLKGIVSSDKATPPEFKEGKIAAMRKKLTDEGLALQAKTSPAAEIPVASASAANGVEEQQNFPLELPGEAGASESVQEDEYARDDIVPVSDATNHPVPSSDSIDAPAEGKMTQCFEASDETKPDCTIKQRTNAAPDISTDNSVPVKAAPADENDVTSSEVVDNGLAFDANAEVPNSRPEESADVAMLSMIKIPSAQAAKRDEASSHVTSEPTSTPSMKSDVSPTQVKGADTKEPSSTEKSSPAESFGAKSKVPQQEASKHPPTREKLSAAEENGTQEKKRVNGISPSPTKQSSLESPSLSQRTGKRAVSKPTLRQSPLPAQRRLSSPLRKASPSPARKSPQVATGRRKTLQPAQSPSLAQPRTKSTPSSVQKQRPATRALLESRQAGVESSASRGSYRASSARRRSAPFASKPQDSVVASTLPVTPSRNIDAVPRRASTPGRPRTSPRAPQELFTPTTQSMTSPPRVSMTALQAEQAGHRLHEQARLMRERLEKRRLQGSSPLAAADGTSPFTPRRLSNPRRGNPSVGGMERLESLYRDALQRSSKLEFARRAEEKSPKDCTFTPEMSTRPRGRSRSRRGERDDAVGGDGVDPSDGGSRFDALFQDAKRRQEKIAAMAGARRREVIGTGSPVITERGRRKTPGRPLEERMKDNAERWARKWEELEAKRLVQEREGCTFMPQVVAGGRSASVPRLRPGNGGDNGGFDLDGRTSFEAFELRMRRFIAARERKLAQLKREQDAKEKAEATFRPRVTPANEEATATASTQDEDVKSPSSNDIRKGRNSSKGEDVFDRLLRAATEQEMNRAALKEELLKQERAQFGNFKPRLPRRQSEDGAARARPFDARLKESTEHWVQSRSVRDQQRAELEARECTFRPDLGGARPGSAGGGSRRSSSAGPRGRSRVSRVGANEVASFQARNTEFQVAREKRLSLLREENLRRELQEATFHPVIGAVSVDARTGETSGDDGHAARRPRSRSKPQGIRDHQETGEQELPRDRQRQVGDGDDYGSTPEPQMPNVDSSGAEIVTESTTRDQALLNSSVKRGDSDEAATPDGEVVGQQQSGGTADGPGAAGKPLHNTHASSAVDAPKPPAQSVIQEDLSARLQHLVEEAGPLDNFVSDNEEQDDSAESDGMRGAEEHSDVPTSPGLGEEPDSERPGRRAVTSGVNLSVDDYFSEDDDGAQYDVKHSLSGHQTAQHAMRSLEDFERFQQEIQEKMREL